MVHFHVLACKTFYEISQMELNSMFLRVKLLLKEVKWSLIPGCIKATENPGFMHATMTIDLHEVC